MGRPLKISKAQTVLTITGTATSGVVTTSTNLTTAGVGNGMPFTVASNVGGLVSGTTYYVQGVTSNTTFTVSSSQLSVQPRTYPTLTSTTGQSVAATVGQVDYAFNNPNGSNTSQYATSWGAVGGNTGYYFPTTLVNVAFGANITGTMFASTSSNVVVGNGTDFANVANGTQLYALWGAPGTYNPHLIGTIANNVGNIKVAVANSTATGNIIGTSGNAQTLVVNTPITFDTSFGGLSANTQYWVLTIANAAAFTVSSAPGGAPIALTSNASVTANAISNQAILSANAANNASGYNNYGDPILGALPEAGYIVRQKGKSKYLVHGTVTGITAQAYTANLANGALTPNTMNIIATYANSGTAHVFSLNDYQTEVFPTTVAAGSLVAGTQYVIYQSGTTNWTAVGAASNITGITFTATGSGSGTGLAVLPSVQPDVIATFGTAYAPNAAAGQYEPVVTINNG